MDNMNNTIFNARRVQIEYTSGQREALEKVSDFLKSKDNFFLLAGYSGCGKTTIAENIASFTGADLMAPTNAAVNRLKSKLNTSKSDFGTIHSVLFAPGKKVGKFYEKGGFKRGKAYIIDECSMIDKYVLDVVIKNAIERNCKIIFMGDSFQLEPVGENPFIFNWEKSYPEYFYEHNKYELTEVKRYDGNLLKIATELRINKKPAFSKIDNDDLIVEDKFTKQLLRDIKAENDYVVLTSTNARRMNYNHLIRSVRFKENGGNLNFAINKDKLVSVNNNTHYSNGELFIINNATFRFEYLIPVEKKNRVNGEDDYKNYRIVVYVQDGKIIVLVPDLEEPSMQAPTLMKGLNEIRETIAPQNYKLLTVEWEDAKSGELKQMIKKDVIICTYGYAISCHKAQGQEWDNVYIDAYWLMPVWDSAKWFYTAITRAKSKVQVTTNKYLKIT